LTGVFTFVGKACRQDVSLELSKTLIFDN
jgi:hypothetical protein